MTTAENIAGCVTLAVAYLLPAVLTARRLRARPGIGRVGRVLAAGLWPLWIIPALFWWVLAGGD